MAPSAVHPLPAHARLENLVLLELCVISLSDTHLVLATRVNYLLQAKTRRMAVEKGDQEGLYPAMSPLHVVILRRGALGDYTDHSSRRADGDLQPRSLIVATR